MCKLTCKTDSDCVPSGLEECTKEEVPLADLLLNPACRLMDREILISISFVRLGMEVSPASRKCPRERSNLGNNFASYRPKLIKLIKTEIELKQTEEN